MEMRKELNLFNLLVQLRNFFVLLGQFSQRFLILFDGFLSFFSV